MPVATGTRVLLGLASSLWFRARRLESLQGRVLASMPPVLQFEAGPSFGDGAYQPGAHVTIHSMNNLEEGLRAKVIGYDATAKLYIVKDAAGATWGLRAEKLRAMQTMDLGEGWQEVPEGVTVPGGAQVRFELDTGKKLARCPDTGQKLARRS